MTTIYRAVGVSAIVALSWFAAPATPAVSAFNLPYLLLAQVPFDQAARDLASSDPTVRLRAAQLLKEAAYPEAAVPLARAIGDPQDEVQLAAIAAELNIFLADRIVPQKRVGLVVEVRNAILAESAFSAGPSALGARAVPIEVLTALRAAVRDDNPRVGIEALYAFGTLGVLPDGAARRELLRASGADIAALTGAPDPAMRYAALRVMGRVFAWRAHDESVEPTVGDAVITALNDSDRVVNTTAMRTLGAMRYERGVQALTDLFTFYAKGDNAEAALDALAHIAHPTSAPVFVAQLTGRGPAQRVIAIEGLARLGDPARLTEITAAVDADRTDAAALAGVFATVKLSPAGSGSIEQLVQGVTRGKLREQARQYLVEVAPGRSQAFAPHLLDPDARVRLAVVEALGAAADPAALRLVEPLAQDRDPQVARAAERAVARLRAVVNRRAS